MYAPPPNSTLFPYTPLFRPLGRLPLEHFVRHPLERLPQHHEPAGVRIAGAEVEVREPAVAAAMAPFGGEYDQVECVGRLRSEEHTSELQSQSNLVCRLLLAK